MEHNSRHDPAITPLGRYWDEFQGGRPAGPNDLDPTLAETVHRLHARDDAPGADAAFAIRLLTHLEDIMDTTPQDFTNPIDPLRPRLRHPATSQTRDMPRWPPAPPPSFTRVRRWPLPHLTSAAFVIFTLVFAYLAFGLPRPGGRDEQGAGVAPAIVAPGTPSPSSPTDETLVAITLPAGVIPAEVTGGLTHYSVAAGR